MVEGGAEKESLRNGPGTRRAVPFTPGVMKSFALLSFALLLLSSVARAQVAPATAPPVVQAWPPIQAQPTQTPQPAHWRPGDPAPPGYHVEERPRKGLVVAGLIVAGVPYFFSVVGASAAQSNNASGLLYVPVAGPWLTMGQRTYECNPDANNQSTKQSLQCVGDIFAVMGLIADGVLQATGATLLVVGLAATRSELVRDDASIRIAPMRVGTGYGTGIVGTF
jgi:hypothetical protein